MEDSKSLKYNFTFFLGRPENITKYESEKDIVNEFPVMLQGILNILRTSGTVSEVVKDS